MRITLLLRHLMLVLSVLSMFFTSSRALAATSPCAILTSPIVLHISTTNPNVVFLQKILNFDPATNVASSGPGSPGSETSYYGPLTTLAIKRFQQKYTGEILTPSGLTQPTGFAGPATRKKLFSLYCANGTPQALLSHTASTTPPATNPSSTSGSLTLSTPSCAIAAGSSTCTVFVSWTSSGTRAPSISQDTVVFSLFPNNTPIPRTISHGSSTFTLKDASSTLATRTASAACMEDTVWNGTTCVVAPPLRLVPPLVPSGPKPTGSFWRFGFYWPLAASTYPPSAVPWSKYTHVSQMGIMPTSNCGIDDTSYQVASTADAFVAAAHQNNVKALVTLIQDKSTQAIVMCTDPNHLSAFVSTIKTYITSRGYDGIDLDWEAGIVPTNYQNFVRELRVQLPNKLVTADISITMRDFLAPIQDSLDMMNLMNYDQWGSDYRGLPQNRMYHNAALLTTGSGDLSQNATSNITFLTSAKLRPEKIGLGMPFYGYVLKYCSASLCSSQLNDKMTVPPAENSSVTQIDFKTLVNSKYWLSGKKQWDAVRASPFISYTGSSTGCASSNCDSSAFVTYSDPAQMQNAVALALQLKLGGIMAFALHQEYLSDKSGDARYPLSTAIYEALSTAGKL